MNDSSATGIQLKFPLTQGLTALSLNSGDIVAGPTLSFKNYEASIDNFACFSGVTDLMLVPLFGKRGQKLGVAQFYNCRSGAITDSIRVSFELSLRIGVDQAGAKVAGRASRKSGRS
jgi:hypothetical protein